MLSGFTQWLRICEEFEEPRLEMLVAKSRVSVTCQPSQVGSPHRIRLADHAESPADRCTGRCGDGGFEPELFVALADRPAVSDDTLAVEHATEEVGHMPHLFLVLGPSKFERLSRDPCHPGVAIGLDD